MYETTNGTYGTYGDIMKNIMDTENMTWEQKEEEFIWYPIWDTTNNVKKLSKNFNEEESELINEFVFPETLFKCVGINISIQWGMFLRIVWSNAFCRLFINDMECINVPIQLFLIENNESSRGAFIHLSRKFPIPFTLKGEKIKIVVSDFIVIGDINKESKMNEVYTLMLSCYKRK